MGKLLLAALLLAAACATTEPWEGSGDPNESVPLGRRLYETSCNRCHALFMPRSFDVGEWRFYVNKYGRRARLAASDRELVFQYLAAHARR